MSRQGLGSGSDLIEGRFRIIQDAPLPPLAGIKAFQAVDVLEPGLSYVGLTPDHVSPQFDRFEKLRHPSLMPVLAQGYADGVMRAIVPAPSGTPLFFMRGIWRENRITAGVIKPLASLLSLIRDAGLALRCLRPDTIYVAPGMSQPVVAPVGLTWPAAHQPILFEPLSSAVCAPAARGSGTVEDDVFSLGVIVLFLATGALPLAGLPDEEVLQRRFSVGSADAYMQGQAVPHGLMSVLRAMLSDDPTQRPLPSDLINMESSKLFSVRREKAARAPIVIGGRRIWRSRELAWQGARHPDEFLNLVRDRTVETWLDTALYEPEAARHLVSLVNTFGDHEALKTDEDFLSQAVHAVDPQAPVFRQGLWFWPDSLPAMLAEQAETGKTPDPKTGIIPLVVQFLGQDRRYEAWGGPVATQVRALAQSAKRSRRKGVSRILRLFYDTNPWQCCLSPLCLTRGLSEIGAVLAHVDRHLADQPEATGAEGVLDPHILAFLESQCLRLGGSVPPPASATGTPFWLADLRLLATAQYVGGARALPHVARWFRRMLLPELEMWRSRTEKERRGRLLAQAIEGGQLRTILAIIDDAAGLAADEQGYDAARQELDRIQDLLASQRSHISPEEGEMRRVSDFVTLLTGIALGTASLGLEILGG